MCYLWHNDHLHRENNAVCWGAPIVRPQLIERPSLIEIACPNKYKHSLSFFVYYSLYMCLSLPYTVQNRIYWPPHGGLLIRQKSLWWPFRNQYLLFKKIIGKTSAISGKQVCDIIIVLLTITYLELELDRELKPSFYTTIHVRLIKSLLELLMIIYQV